MAECDAKANEIDTVAGGHHEPVCRTRKFEGMIPTSASEHLELAVCRSGGVRECSGRIRGEPIAAPFPNVPVHVVEPPWIGPLLAHWMGSAFTVFQRPRVLICLGGDVPEAEEIGRAGSTGVFPFGFGREPVGVARRQPSRRLFALCYGRTIGRSIVIADLLDWTKLPALIKTILVNGTSVAVDEAGDDSGRLAETSEPGLSQPV